MHKTTEALCRSCRTLASPTCECGILATLNSTTGLIIFSDDLTKVSLTNVWRNYEGRLLWLEETNLLAHAKVSPVLDIEITKDTLGTL